MPARHAAGPGRPGHGSNRLGRSAYDHHRRHRRVHLLQFPDDRTEYSDLHFAELRVWRRRTERRISSCCLWGLIAMPRAGVSTAAQLGAAPRGVARVLGAEVGRGLGLVLSLQGRLGQRPAPDREWLAKADSQHDRNDTTGSTPPEEEPARRREQEPDTSQPAKDPGYLTQTGEAAAEDGSVAPIIGGLPAVEGSGLGYRRPAG